MGLPNIQIYQIANGDMPYIPKPIVGSRRKRSSGLFSSSGGITAKARRPDTSQSKVASWAQLSYAMGDQKFVWQGWVLPRLTPRRREFDSTRATSIFVWLQRV